MNFGYSNTITLTEILSPVMINFIYYTHRTVSCKKKKHLIHEKKNRIKKRLRVDWKIDPKHSRSTHQKTPYSPPSLINEHTMLNVIGSDKNKSNVGAGDMRNKQKSNAKKLFQYIIMSRWIMILVDMGPKFQIKVQKCGS